MAMFRDKRPRNPEIVKKIREMYDPKALQEEKSFYNKEFSERSIDFCLDDTDDFITWNNKKMKGTNIDPENRRPVQLTESPISDFDIEFTRLNRTDMTVPSSLSSLQMPSSASFSMECSTPRTGIPTRRSATASHRRSGLTTPRDILRQRQTANINWAKGRPSLRGFEPRNFSTPVRSERTKSSRFVEIQNSKSNSVASSSNGKAPDTNEVPYNNSNVSVSKPTDTSDRTLMNANKACESASATIIPETQENDSVIPETQDPQTQSSRTQDIYIPETQEDDIPTTQDDVATVDPVQAQVPKQQAEPQHVVNISSHKILARPPIRNQSPISTPSKYTPSIVTSGKPTPRTPLTSKDKTPKTAVPNALDATVTRASNAAGSTIIVVTSPPTKQSTQTPAPPSVKHDNQCQREWVYAWNANISNERHIY